MRGFQRTDIKKYIWIFPIIGATFGIITFLAPAITLNLSSYYTINWYYWIWGLTSYTLTNPDPYGPPGVSEVAFTNNISLLTISIISSVMILIAVIILLIEGITSKRNIQYSKKSMIKTGISTILLIIGGIIFWVGAGWPTTLGTGSVPPGYSVWNYFHEGFSVYAPFIACGIALDGMALNYLVFKYRIEEPAESEEKVSEIDELKKNLDKIYFLENQIADRIAKLETTQKRILDQMADLRKIEELESPPI